MRRGEGSFGYLILPFFPPGSQSVRTSLSSRIQEHNDIKMVCLSHQGKPHSDWTFSTSDLSRRVHLQHSTGTDEKSLPPEVEGKILFCVKRQICWMSFPGWVQSIHKVCSDFYRCVDKTRKIKLWNFFQVWGHSEKCCCMFQSKIESSLVYCSQLPNLKCKIGKKSIKKLND